jgi:hypothetical protein
MKFVWVPSINRFRRTEGEVKKEKLAYEVIDIETDKDSLIDRFNAYEEKLERASAMVPVGQAAPAEVGLNLEPAPPEARAAIRAAFDPPPPPPPARPRLDEDDAKRRLVQALTAMSTEAIEDKILSAKGTIFARYLAAAVTRLGELGQPAFASFQALRKMGSPGEEPREEAKRLRFIPGSEERGLRYLALAQISDLMPAAAEPEQVQEAAE